jgi:NAD(P)-dependent dehydrogenase (short-subunit alcohol dehydrogenase family)
MKDVRGKTALVTGGASGMGLLWCERLAKDGADLVIWDINQDAADEAAERLRSSTGRKVYAQKVDVSDATLVDEAAEEALSTMGHIDVLVNNAGIVFAAPYLDSPKEKLSATIDVDLKAPMWTMQAFLPGMIQRNQGHIVNISSASGFIGVPRMPAYVAAKWGLIGLTESVRLELKLMHVSGVHFTLVCPSYVDTGMFAGAKPPLLTKMLKPEDVINTAYRAFKENRYIVKEPWLVKVTPPLKALLPYQVFDLISGLLGANKSMTDWRNERS